MSELKKKFCCTDMSHQIEYECGQHLDPYECLDKLVSYIDRFDEYGLIIHDGGTASCIINFCPWCGIKLPASKRDEWFHKLEELGFNSPSEEVIPDEFNSSRWYEKKILTKI